MVTKEVSVRRSDHELSKQLEISIKKNITSETYFLNLRNNMNANWVSRSTLSETESAYDGDKEVTWGGYEVIFGIL